MLKIRLARGGRKKLPYYRIVVTNVTSPRDSKFLEKIGTHNPLLEKTDENRVTIVKDRAEYWLSVGAQPTEKVAKFLRDLGVKGAEKHQPTFVAKKKGTGLKKKALENNIVNAVTKASALTGQLLGFAQKGKYAVKKVDLSQILTSAHALFEPMARKTLKSRLILHPEPIYVKADATQLEQVLLNLLINARDALENCENAKI